MLSKICIMLLAAFSLVSADVYLHSPRGQNDRCDEKSNNRNNEERMWDSEDNAAGGYSWCDKELVFYTNTYLDILFYTQHSCGNGQFNKDDPYNPESTICQHVLQLGCEDKFRMFAGKEHDTYKLTDGMSLGRPGADKPDEIKDDPDNVYNTFGDTCTQTKPTWDECTPADVSAANAAGCNDLDLSNGGNRGTFNSDTCKCSDRKMKTYGYHEPEHWWEMCKARDRNSGLFVADKHPDPNGGATKDRQEPNSARYGFECTEERDYYPYWHPTPWIDLAVYTSNKTDCDTIYSQHSQNSNDKCHCMPSADVTDYANQDTEEAYEAYKYNQKPACEDAKFFWVCWGSWGLPNPYCDFAPAQTDNRLGNPNGLGDAASDKYKGDVMASHTWHISDDIIPDGETDVRCVIRLRYNISTAETGYDFDQTDNPKVTTNPVMTYGDPFNPDVPASSGSAEASSNGAVGYNGTPMDHLPVRMAVNTAQFGRTFEDRTYVFRVTKQRPDGLEKATIHNLNVRGKRGNIAQVRNCVEYDFVPMTLTVSVGDWVYFQWCGSDYNSDGNAGEGRAGTDRSNVVAVPNYQRNMPQPLNSTSFIFDEEDLRQLAWIGQQDKYCYTVDEMLDRNKKGDQGNDPKSCHFLNGVRDPDRPEMPTAYYAQVVQVKRSGTFTYMNSRNNNFTNRSQKAVITTESNGLSLGAKVGIGIGVGLGVLVIVGVIAVALLVSAGKLTLPKYSSRV